MMLVRLLSMIALGVVLLTQVGCHTTQFGKSIGYPTPQERAQDSGAYFQ